MKIIYTYIHTYVLFSYSYLHYMYNKLLDFINKMVRSKCYILLEYLRRPEAKLECLKKKIITNSQRSTDRSPNYFIPILPWNYGNIARLYT